MTAQTSAEVRTHAAKQAKARVRRWRTVGFPVTLLLIGALASLALHLLLTGMGGLG